MNEQCIWVFLFFTQTLLGSVYFLVSTLCVMIRYVCCHDELLSFGHSFYSNGFC